ncbi:hypothetical protein [Candidatus Poriferisodalis sp.]|uniref:hypothetical protein n=1 Tax=Candidatus Poriferisodalis sp. TaxID=3101277 RepID=UPI003D0DDE63
MADQTLRWKRIEPGRYETADRRYLVRKNTSWPVWHAVFAPASRDQEEIGTFHSMQAAKDAAQRHATLGR